MRIVLLLAFALSAFAQAPVTPVARKVPKTITIHGDERVDEYGWMREKTSAETLAYLNAENAYADAVMKPSEGLQKQLYD